jgi:hypothetical protein
LSLGILDPDILHTHILLPFANTPIQKKQSRQICGCSILNESISEIKSQILLVTWEGQQIPAMSSRLRLEYDVDPADLLISMLRSLND